MTNQIDRCFAALSDPTRRAVIERLVEGPASVSDLHGPHAMALPTFLRHLRVLEDAGLLRSAKKGRVRTCHIEAGPLAEVQGWLDSQRRLWESRLTRLDRLASALERTPQ